MRRLWHFAISAWFLGASVCAAAPEQAPAESIVVEFRLNGRAVQAFASRDSAGEIHADAETLRALGVARVGEGAAPLRDVPGLSYRFDDAESAVEIDCAPECFAAQTIDAGARRDVAIARAAPGAFLNVDLAATAIERARDLAAAFEFVGFGPFGSLGANVVATEAGLLRLDTNWTTDFPRARTSLRLGDSVTRAGATGVPVRFGGVQLATNFSLDPGFVTFPTPTLHGEAAAPSTLDLYVDGALRMTAPVDAGPFSVVDAPVLVGAGVAQLVVTDPLGREQVLAQPFYASPSLLRRGLADYAVSVGWTRRNFTRASSDYADAFVSGVYRRGLSDAFTGEARVEFDQNLSGLGLGGSAVHPLFGQFDLAVAASEGAEEGTALRGGWTRTSADLTLGLSLQGASAGFRRLGEDAAPDKLEAAALMSVDFAEGVAALTYAAREPRTGAEVQTVAVSYAPKSEYGQWSFDALWVSEGHVALGVRFAAPLWGNASGAGRLRLERGDLSTTLSLHDSRDDGFDWRANAAMGGLDRYAAAIRHVGEAHEASLEASRVADRDGLRLQLAAGFVLIDGDAFVSRPIRGSFALVDVGRADVPIMRDRRRVGVTGLRGRFLITDLRANEPNSIAIALDELPLGVLPARETIEVAPPARSGVVVRFDLGEGRSGESRIVDEAGAALPAGALLRRVRDGARFPIGAGGRAYLTNVLADDVLESESGCRVFVAPEDVGTSLTCRAA